jgi:short-subunit dehydrogenase
MSFENRVVVITGASSGIGWSLAKQFAAEKAKLGLLARRRDNLEKLAQEIEQAGGVTAIAPADITNRAETVPAIHSLRDQLGPVDLLIANAGLGKPTNLDMSNMDEVEEMFKVNTLGVVYSIEAVLPDMLRRRQGHLAAVSSLAAYKGLPGESAYCASKAAVSVYMEGLRLQLRNHGIRVTTICPGFVTTPMTEQHDFQLPFVMDADKAARLIVRALRRRKKVFNFPWQTALLMKLTRWLPDWFLLRRLRGFVKDISPELVANVAAGVPVRKEEGISK